MITELESGGGGLDINGIIEQAKTKGVVTAGDFVTIVEEYLSSYKNIKLSEEESMGFYVSTQILSDNKVFIVHSSTNSTYGMLCTISKQDIIVEEDVLLYTLRTGCKKCAIRKK